MANVTLSLFAGAGAQFLDNSGNVLTGGKIYTYAAGTTTPQTTYTSSNGVTPHSNPIILDASGRVPGGEIWITNGLSYKFVLETSTGVLIGTYDNVSNITEASQLSFTGFKGQVGVVQDLADNDGSDWVGFTQDGTGAVPISAQDKMRQIVSVKDFGAVGDGVTDDTTAVQNALNYAISNSNTLYFPAGQYRVTSVYTQSTNNADLTIEGAGNGRFESSTNGAQIILDSASANFMNFSGIGQLTVKNINFKCVQYLLNRSFFRFSSTLIPHFFSNVSFFDVERPIVYAAGCYFQNSSFRDVLFANSGTIHSESTNLVGTLLILDNVTHEGTVPVNSNECVCNLSGIREIKGRNLLLEGSLPSATWTVLTLGEVYDADWTGEPLANIDGFWSEWTVHTPLWNVDQQNGSVYFTMPGQFSLPTYPYKLSNKAFVEISGASFVGSVFDPSTMFVLDSALCTVILNKCFLRTTDFIKQRIFYRDCQYTVSTGTNALASTVAPYKILEFTGAPFDSALGSYGAFGGSTLTFSTDATYGRKIVITPSGGSFNAYIQSNPLGQFLAGDQFLTVMKFKMPNLNVGAQVVIQQRINGVTTTFKTYDSSYNSETITLVVPIRIAVNNITVGVAFSTAGGTVSSGNLEIYSFTIYYGAIIPNTGMGRFLSNVTFSGTAAPTTGTWAQGDVINNSSASSGGYVGWVCTTSGAPGTWKTFGLIS